MKRFIKGLTYKFNRNLGLKDRIMRTIISLMVLIPWINGSIQGVIGLVLGILAITILGTAASARCGVTYWMNANTMGKTEKEGLDQKEISYE